jgi:hypothetical protein
VDETARFVSSIRNNWNNFVGEKMKKYRLRPIFDQNVLVEEIEAKTYEDALEYALDILGYTLNEVM